MLLVTLSACLKSTSNSGGSLVDDLLSKIVAMQLTLRPERGRSKSKSARHEKALALDSMPSLSCS